MSKRLTPSTIDGGFILTTPALENPATSDHVFQRILQCKFPLEYTSSDYAHTLTS